MTDTYVGAFDTVLLQFQVSNGASPEVFAHPCLINLSRSLSLTANAIATVLADCTDPTKPGKTVRVVNSTDLNFDGAGKVNRSDVKTYADWLLSGAPKNVKIQCGGVTGDLTLTGSILLVDFSLTGQEHGQFVDVAVKFAQADQFVSTAHA